MHTRRIVISLISTGGLGCLFLLTGCDDSKSSGTQVQMSPAVKAEINDMRSSQKDIMAERKAAAAKKGRRR